jgi:hypothetical protein
MACRPILILEGDGDRSAVPYLIREFSESKILPVSNPIIKQNVPRLSRTAELEKFLCYAMEREDADSVLILLDVDDDCAKVIVENWMPRIHALNPTKKIGVGLFVREFEAYFLACLDLIANKYVNYGWSIEDWNEAADHELIRGAKERLSRHMRSGKSYKETLDQPKFVSAVDFARLRERCRSFRHLESLLGWLLEGNQAGIYPTNLDRP